MTGLGKLVGALAVAVTSASLLGVATAPAQAAPSDGPVSAAASCYGGARAFAKPNGVFETSRSNPFTTTAACSDINVYSDQNTYALVCFKTGSTFNNCQANYTHLVRGQWAVVATNVLDNRKFILSFYNDAGYSGLVAA